MKRSKISKPSFSFVGAASFFALVALLMQIAILVYDYIRARTDDPLQIAILILILIIMISTLCTLFDWARRKLTVERPTKKILDATDRIAEGDFSVRLDIAHEYGKYNEYDLIMDNINKLAAELGKTEVLRVDFISNVSHEIKTPLSVIQSYATLLQDESLDPQTRKEYSKILINACKRTTDLVTNILKLNKLENQEIQDKKEPFDLTAALSEAIVEFEPLIEAKSLTLSCDLDDVTAVSTKSLLEIVWNNLISNAIKFTGDGGEIRISLKRLGNDAQIQVEDTGIGMSNEVGKRIFEKFYQGDASHSSNGNGLGLALVKKVIDILGGEISVRSALGKGSTFTVLLKDVIQ